MVLWIRRKVSKKKRRYSAGGYDLDLTYICDNIVAMGFPSVGVESIYRNRLVDVRKFLDGRHQSHYKVYNLCSERQYAAECFDSRTAWYPFDDHNCPPFDMLCKLMTDMEDYLAQDENNNVAVIHCKAGKGRTGLVIASHLLHSGQYATSRESLNHFGFCRTHNSKGVTIPSQQRWVAMYERYLYLKAAGERLPSPPTQMCLERIELTGGLPRFDEVVFTCATKKWSSKNWVANWMKKSREGIGNKSITIVPSEDIKLMQDVHIAFNKRGKVSGKKRRVFGCWLNMQFVNDDGKFKLSEQELDGIAKSKKRRRQNFTVDIYFG
eukprot:CAMPEP_0197719976 /NCGR_PEP_ID=MMETSP1434-20131217/3498_1 /TAXON_ID=265543 /ORGANISM="Minutocellus polymorphus, Strain CCMP3303" /LENGTH=322 /DNA_ID=CAMNT_0043304769 /DNA_START=153 /DNA_END=1117 /DNA_ORIENTATION=-